MAATVDGAAGTRATASTSFSRLRERSFVLVFRVRAPSSHLRSRPRLAATAPDPTIGTREHHGSPTPGLRDPDRLRCALSLPFFFSRESPSFGSHDTEPYRRGTRRDRSRRSKVMVFEGENIGPESVIKDEGRDGFGLIHVRVEC
ncbi:hypothetical protein DEO72_LG7g1757 [Vigna unguiculata]|uniref:Uncharacterized protein n=1 Tax=Vigna unguiculata TaxID=3917 RepID=A0A4D6MKD6_VIGUN|nr:hypothetical protein DEO72_LG7g1757 [Vigna unguiculata]